MKELERAVEVMAGKGVERRKIIVLGLSVSSKERENLSEKILGKTEKRTTGSVISEQKHLQLPVRSRLGAGGGWYLT